MTVRLVAVPLDVSWTPAQAALALRGDAHPFALVGAWAGGGAILGSEPVRLAAAGDDPFDVLDRQPAVEHAGAPDGAVGGGWVGYLGYALAHRVERLPPDPPARAPLPPFALAFYDHVLRLDADGRWWFEALETPSRADALRRRRAQLEGRAGRAAAARPFRAGPFTVAAPGVAGLRDAVARCVERIHAGELFQANLSLRLEGPFAGDPLDAFAAALAVEPRHGAFLAGPWGAAIGLSPELFLRRRGREVLSRPIKGTAPREGGDAGDAAREALVDSAKDRAENVMIVDLMRNDLGRVCEYGTVAADPGPVAEAHPGVWHLVAGVRGRLRVGVGDGALVRAAFPPGSVTGAPKVQALKVITELEGSARRLYTGAVGFASPVAGLELNVVIRTFEVSGGRAWLGAGGGIVADSDPDAEVREALAKARPLVAALGAELHAPAPRSAARVPALRALAGGRERPDAALGIIETIGLRGGRLVDLARHLERLATSVAEVYDEALPGDLAERARRAAAGSGADGGLRIDVIPARGGLDVALRPRAAAPQSTAPTRLAAVTLPGGLGAHKWRDRRLLEALEARLGAMPLLVDADGCVLEAAVANVWLVEGDALVTPPADGRILPGVTRRRALALPGAREEPFGLDRLEAADGVLLTSSVAVLRVADAGRGVAASRVRELRDALAAPPRG